MMGPGLSVMLPWLHWCSFPFECVCVCTCYTNPTEIIVQTKLVPTTVIKLHLLNFMCISGQKTPVSMGFMCAYHSSTCTMFFTFPIQAIHVSMLLVKGVKIIVRVDKPHGCIACHVLLATMSVCVFVCLHVWFTSVLFWSKAMKSGQEVLFVCLSVCKFISPFPFVNNVM